MSFCIHDLKKFTPKCIIINFLSLLIRNFKNHVRNLNNHLLMGHLAQKNALLLSSCEWLFNRFIFMIVNSLHNCYTLIDDIKMCIKGVNKIKWITSLFISSDTTKKWKITNPLRFQVTLLIYFDKKQTIKASYISSLFTIS